MPEVQVTVNTLTDGVKAAIIGFIFVCIVLPRLIKNRHQYYMALAAVLLGMVFQLMIALFGFTPYAGFGRFCTIMSHLLDIVAILLLVMAAGGLSPGQLAGDMSRAFEVLRRGETEKEIIIPLSGQPGSGKAVREEEAPARYVIDDPSPPTGSAGAGGEKPKGPEGSIPLE
jgi:hypothetical protein